MKNGYNRWMSRAFWIAVIWTVLALVSIVIFLFRPDYPVGLIISICSGVVTALMVTDKIKNAFYEKWKNNGVNNQVTKGNINNSSNNTNDPDGN